MARSRIYRSPRHNPPPGREDELMGDLPGVPTKDNNTPTAFPAVFWA